MTHTLGAQSAYQPTPLSADEKARAEVNFAPYVAQQLAAQGRFRVTADREEMVELFEQVARKAADILQRRLDSYSNGREIVITFGSEGEAPGLSPVRTVGV